VAASGGVPWPLSGVCRRRFRGCAMAASGCVSWAACHRRCQISPIRARCVPPPQAMPHPHGTCAGATRIAGGILVMRGLLLPAAAARLQRFLGAECARHVRRGSIKQALGSERSFPVGASQPAVQPITEALRDWGLLDERVLGALTGLASHRRWAQGAHGRQLGLPLGPTRVEFHRDYASTAAAATAWPGVTPPLSVLVAVQDGTRVGFPPHLEAATDVILGLGDALAWGGHVLHAGCGYDTPNLRLHLYLYTAQAAACAAQPHLLASAQLQREWTASLTDRRPAAVSDGVNS